MTGGGAAGVRSGSWSHTEVGAAHIFFRGHCVVWRGGPAVWAVGRFIYRGGDWVDDARRKTRVCRGLNARQARRGSERQPGLPDSIWAGVDREPIHAMLVASLHPNTGSSSPLLATCTTPSSLQTSPPDLRSLAISPLTHRHLHRLVCHRVPRAHVLAARPSPSASLSQPSRPSSPGTLPIPICMRLIQQ